MSSVITQNQNQNENENQNQSQNQNQGLNRDRSNMSVEVPDCIKKEEDVIIDSLMQIGKRVKKQLGSLYGREKFFQKAFQAELLSISNMNSCVEYAHPVYYTATNGCTVSVGNIFVDVVTPEFFIEFKNCKEITDNHKRQACFYANILNKRGYIINFCDRDNDKVSILKVGN